MHSGSIRVARACFSIIRAFRPVRLVNRVEALHITLAAIIESLKEVASLLVLIFACKVAYSIVGMQVTDEDSVALMLPF